MYHFSYSYEAEHAYEYNHVVFSLTVMTCPMTGGPDNKCQRPFRFQVKTSKLKHFYADNLHSVSLINSGFHILYGPMLPSKTFSSRVPSVGVTDFWFIKKR